MCPRRWWKYPLGTENSSYDQNGGGAIAKLQAFDLIQEAGKKDAVGRPNLYATTDYFLDYMGINSLDELVAIDQLELEEQETSLFREDASEELEDSDN